MLKKYLLIWSTIICSGIFVVKLASLQLTADSYFNSDFAIQEISVYPERGLIFDRHGERARRQKARMKFLIKDIGLESFIALIEEEKKALSLQDVEIDSSAYDKEIQIPNRFTLDVRYCDPLLMAFLDMCTAIVLIQGKSALSYLAGIVNENTVISPINQSHAKLPRWHSSVSIGVEIREPMLG